MRIRSDILDVNHLFAAAADIPPGVALGQPPTVHGSRSRHHAWEVFLTGHRKTGVQWGAPGGLKTASWDEWGMFLARLYIIDPELTIPRAYGDLDDFRETTCDRFLGEEWVDRPEGSGWTLVVDDPDPIHHYHRWNWSSSYTTVTGIHVRSCRGTKNIDCTAQLRVR